MEMKCNGNESQSEFDHFIPLLKDSSTTPLSHGLNYIYYNIYHYISRNDKLIISTILVCLKPRQKQFEDKLY